MPNSLSLAQIERLKREAKQYSRAFSFTHSQALDRLARSYGYANWSLLMKNNQLPVDTQIIATLDEPRKPIVFNRTMDEMMKSVRKIPEPHGLPDRIDEARRQVANISHEFISAQNAVDFAVDFMTCLLRVPRYKIYSAAKVNWEMRCWLPYCVHPVQRNADNQDIQILVNRRYKSVGQMNDDWVEYEAFPHLHTRLNREQLLTFSHRSNSVGYLFSDGFAPWHTRKDAEIYLERLRILQTVIKE